MLSSNRKPTNFEIEFLSKNGFNHIPSIHDWVFSRDGFFFDLSAADLYQIENIFEKKLFLSGVDVM
jgi:hypothetical protein